MIKNKNFIFIILILFLIVSSNFVYAGEEKYNKKLLNEFENKNWILVTVTLRDISNLDYLNVKTKYEKLQIYKNKKTLNKKSQDKIISMLSESDFKIKSVSIAGRGFNGEITKEGLAKLEVNPNVLKIYKPIYGSGLLDDSVSLINVSSNVWDLGYTGKGKTICVIDSGIDNTHSGLNGQIKAEHCFCTVSDYGSGGCCPDNTGNDALATDDYGHGTHVSGIIASKDPTYKGVAYDSKLVVVKALDNNNRWIGPDITNAIDWCVTNKDVYDISIISMSLGSDGLFTNPDDCDSIPSGEAITAAYNAGIFVVAASGNNGNENGITHPACVSRATSVGATEKDDTMWSNTNRVGGLLDLLAPGEDINSLNWGGGCIPGCSCFGDYMNCDGTSMAAPHVAGAAALLLELDDSLTPDLIKTLLRNTGVMIDGYPRIDVLAAIQSISTLEDSEILTITQV